MLTVIYGMGFAFILARECLWFYRASCMCVYVCVYVCVILYSFYINVLMNVCREMCVRLYCPPYTVLYTVYTYVRCTLTNLGKHNNWYILTLKEKYRRYEWLIIELFLTANRCCYSKYKNNVNIYDNFTYIICILFDVQCTSYITRHTVYGAYCITYIVRRILFHISTSIYII